MTNNSIKVLVLGLIALLLTYFNKAYSILIMLVLILIYVVNAYQLEKHYQRMGRSNQRQRQAPGDPEHLQQPQAAGKRLPRTGG